MKISELDIHLLAAPQGYYLAHLIPADMNFDSGISATINNQYNLKDKLIYFYGNELDFGGAYLTDNVYSLVVKESSNDDLELEMLIDAINEMHDDMIQQMRKKLAIPKVCWDEMKTIIEEEFKENDIDILICDL